MAFDWGPIADGRREVHCEGCPEHRPEMVSPGSELDQHCCHRRHLSRCLSRSYPGGVAFLLGIRTSVGAEAHFDVIRSLMQPPDPRAAIRQDCARLTWADRLLAGSTWAILAGSVAIAAVVLRPWRRKAQCVLVCTSGGAAQVKFSSGSTRGVRLRRCFPDVGRSRPHCSRNFVEIQVLPTPHDIAEPKYYLFTYIGILHERRVE